jgi:hypothetical protein
MTKRPHTALHGLSLVVLAALAACAMVPLQPDLPRHRCWRAQ